MKDWQCGYELDYLKSLESHFDEYNACCLNPFMQVKKHNIAQALVKGELIGLKGISIQRRVKVMGGCFTMLPDVRIIDKLKGDLVIEAADAYTKPELFSEFYNIIDNEDLGHAVFVKVPCTPETFLIRKQLTYSFQHLGGMYNTFGDVVGLWRTSGYDRQQPYEIPPEEIIQYKCIDGLTIGNLDRELLRLKSHAAILCKISALENTFTNHYSNYNARKAWSAISLRGYSADPAFIIKPDEMNAKWHEENLGPFTLQDTPLRKEFPEVDKLIYETLGSEAFHNVHRIRFMRLAPGGGELRRHTDQVDKDSGVQDGKVMRFHFPLKTNDAVKFEGWRTNGEVETVHMGVGSCWYLDTRKPHRAYNNGTESRIHLVVDVEANDYLRERLNK